jgi:Arc/MetJ family transcription regulator
MDDEEYREIQAAAEAARLTVSAWVRQMLRKARSGGEGPRSPGTRDLPDPARAVPPPVVDAAHPLAREVMERFGLSSPAEALEFALRQATAAPPSRSDLLGLRGTGWSGDPTALRTGRSRDPGPSPVDPPEPP